MLNLSKIRKLQGFTQAQLADKAGISQSTIGRIEKGWDGCTLRMLQTIAQALDVPVWIIVSDERSDAVNMIVNAYNDLSPENQQIWDDMATAALARSAKSDE